MTDDKREAIKAAIADALERRKGARKPLAVPVGMVVAGRQLTARTIDIGLRGLAIEVAEELPARAECHAVFTLPVGAQRHTLRVRAVVVYALPNRPQGFKVGLELTGLADDDARWIEQFLA